MLRHPHKSQKRKTTALNGTNDRSDSKGVIIKKSNSLSPPTKELADDIANKNALLISDISKELQDGIPEDIDLQNTVSENLEKAIDLIRTGSLDQESWDEKIPSSPEVLKEALDIYKMINDISPKTVSIMLESQGFTLNKCMDTLSDAFNKKNLITLIKEEKDQLFEILSPAFKRVIKSGVSHKEMGIEHLIINSDNLLHFKPMIVFLNDIMERLDSINDQVKRYVGGGSDRSQELSESAQEFISEYQDFLNEFNDQKPSKNEFDKTKNEYTFFASNFPLLLQVINKTEGDAQIDILKMCLDSIKKRLDCKTIPVRHRLRVIGRAAHFIYTFAHYGSELSTIFLTYYNDQKKINSGNIQNNITVFKEIEKLTLDRIDVLLKSRKDLTIRNIDMFKGEIEEHSVDIVDYSDDSDDSDFDDVNQTLKDYGDGKKSVNQAHKEAKKLAILFKESFEEIIEIMQKYIQDIDEESQS